MINRDYERRARLQLAIEELQKYGVISLNSTLKAFLEFCRFGKLTASNLKSLGFPEATAYRALNRLKELEVIRDEGRVIRPKCADYGGPSATIWGLTI